MLDLKKFLEIKEKSEKLRKKQDQAEGAIEQLIKDLYKKYLCKDMEEANLLLSKVREQKEKLNITIEQKINCLISKYSSLLED